MRTLAATWRAADKRGILAVLIVAGVLGIIVAYEWSGALAGYRTTLGQADAATRKALEEVRAPLWMVPLVTLVDYAEHSWFCLLIAFVAAGAIQEFVPRHRLIALMGSGRGLLPYALGAGGGPLLSMCSCSIIPLFAGIYRHGAGLGLALAFLLASPALNPAAVLLTLALLSWPFAVARIVVTVSAGMMVGYLTTWFVQRRGPLVGAPAFAPVELEIDPAPFGQRLQSMHSHSWEFVKLVLPLILLGVVIAGLVQALLPASVVARYLGEGLLPVALASAMGVVLYTPTLVEIPFVRGMMAVGMGPGPALAFLLTGPALSLPSILGVTRVVGVRIPALYAVLMWLYGTAAGLAFSWLFPLL